MSSTLLLPPRAQLCNRSCSNKTHTHFRSVVKRCGWKGQGKPGRGKGKGKGKDNDKGKGKGSGAGVGSTYANPGRPKSSQPPQQDRQLTGDIAEYFRRTQNTPRPEARVFAGAQMRGGLEASRPVRRPNIFLKRMDHEAVKFQIMTKSLGLRSSSPLQGTATYFLT